ncbi:ubiquitin carboxyl-terminal hydrolase 25 [Humulus lupulus]|uniref:ubiquitin carboxyl-terminal hydrolase 25 n=1 Tax=Humulus lupulus TaxID=3486 RepID=UPI002B4129C9|nr:ubiquitin carboxyl-terminal hydrolase 25 [Humulus lupulus]
MGLQLQMSWQPSLLSQKRKTGPPLGLKNLGNSCYLNSVLQCLTYTPPLANFCLRKQHSSLCDSSDADRKRDCPFCIIEKRIVRSLSVDLALDAPMKIQNCLRIFSEHFRGGRQEDAHEFLRYVIDACHNTCLRLKKLRRSGGSGSGSTSVVKEIFGGALQSQVKCLSCGTESNKVDEIMDISLDVLHSNSLKDALQKFFQPEVLDGNNKYRCESCKKLVPARKQMSIRQAPNILVIQLKRFEGIFGGKIDKSIAFEDVLVLSSFMCKASQDPRPEYKLFGTIVHSGFSPESGHYYAYIKDAMGRWYCCNDSYVSLSTVQDVLSEKVYVLFFSRTSQRSESVNPPLAGSVLNGVKSRDCNGHETSKSLKPALPLKGMHAKPCEESSRMNMLAVSKVDKVASSPHIKFSINGSSISKGTSSISNGKISKNGSMGTNGDAKETICLEKGEKAKSISVNKNGMKNNEKANGIASKNSQASISTEVCDNSHTKELEISENVTRDELKTTSGPDHQGLVNGGVNLLVKVPSSKRKSREDSCILLAKDAQSRKKIEDLKEVLAKEASSVLRSCGWSEKVYSFMSSGKRLRTEEAGTTSLTDNVLRKLLIADARSTFLSQIPESLKEDLIKRLQLFSQEK